MLKRYIYYTILWVFLQWRIGVFLIIKSTYLVLIFVLKSITYSVFTILLYLLYLLPLRAPNYYPPGGVKLVWIERSYLANK